MLFNSKIRFNVIGLSWKILAKIALKFSPGLFGTNFYEYNISNNIPGILGTFNQTAQLATGISISYILDKKLFPYASTLIGLNAAFYYKKNNDPRYNEAINIVNNFLKSDELPVLMSYFSILVGSEYIWHELVNSNELLIAYVGTAYADLLAGIGLSLLIEDGFEVANDFIFDYLTNNNVHLSIDKFHDLRYEIDRVFTLSTPVPLPLPVTQPSPLVLDLNGDGIQTLSVSFGVYFDHNNNLFAEKTGWVNPFDAFLVRDINNNGIIDNGFELFGDNTLLLNGQKAEHGFSALADLDSNGDGFIDLTDQAWNELLLWQDKNSNGLTDSDELFTLSEAGIISINLNYNSQTYTDSNGNKHLQNSFFTRADGSISEISDLWFLSNPMDSKYTQEIPISDNIVDLIDFNGLGNVLSLHQAMSLDDSGLLISLIDQFTNSDPLTAKNLVWNIIFAWTGVADLDPASRGAFIEDARKLYAMEKFWGQSFLSLSCNLEYQYNPHQKDANKLQIVCKRSRPFVEMS
jgi:hypothetical protein